MTVKVITASDACQLERDGSNEFPQENYATVHAALLANQDLYPHEIGDHGYYYYFALGQYKTVLSYHIYRAGLKFLLSGISKTDTLVSAKLSFTVKSVPGTEGETHAPFNITLVSGVGLSTPFIEGDYHDLLSKVTSYGNVAANYDPDQEPIYEIDINPTGLSVIQSAIKAEATEIYFGLRSSLDISATEATGEDFLEIYGMLSDAEPQLTLTYNSSVKFNNPILRVSGITRTFFSGLGGTATYQNTLVRGGSTNTIVSPISPREIPSLIPKDIDSTYTLVAFSQWLIRNPVNAKKMFGHIPTYQEWVDWIRSMK
jgi:hypothetical protein